MQANRLDVPRLYAIGFTGLLHLVLVSALLLALSNFHIVRPPPGINAKFVPETAPVEPLPPVPQAVLSEPEAVVLPMPLLPPIGDAGNAITVKREAERGIAPVTTPAPAAILAPTIVLPRLDDSHPFVAPFPSTARRLGESGSVVLGFIVDAQGRVVPSSIEVLTSSGYMRLDDAARSAMRRVRFLPGRSDGTATAMRHSFRITYTLDG
jgi:protein TonB